jgi:hypothetical protein
MLTVPAAPSPAHLRPHRNTLWVRGSAVAAFVLPPVLITIFGWIALSPEPTPGLDPSWLAALYMATHNGLAFGRDVAWTYGPLGFLTNPQMWEPHMAELGWAYTVAVRFAFAAAMFHSARTTLGWVGAFVATLVVVSVGLGTFGAAELALMLICANWALEARLGGRAAQAVAGIAGAAAGVEFLLKISTGFGLIAMTAVLVFCLPGRRWRLVLTAGAGFLIALVGCWLLAGQPLGAVPSYIRYGLQISSGYSAAMQLEQPALGWQYSAVLAVLALGLWAVLVTTSGWPKRRRWGLCLIWLLFWFSWFQEGFVRHDGHGVWAFDGLLAGFIAFRWKSGKRVVGTICLSALVLIALAAQSQSLTGDLHPGASWTAFFDDVSAYTSGSQRTTLEQAGRASIRATEPISPTMLSKLRGHTVAVVPFDLDLAWAYNLKFDPIPVLQSYSAYTTALDALDAAFLTSSRAPQRILYEGPATLDGRIGVFDQGQTYRTMLCHYRVIDSMGPLEVLARVPDRCTGAPKRLAVIHAAWGQTITVPKAPRGSWLQYVRIYGTDPSGLARIGALLLKPTERFVQINGGGDARLVTGTATDGLPLQVPPRFDYGGSFDLGIGAKTISVVKGLGAPSGGKPLTYAFYAERIR